MRSVSSVEIKNLPGNNAHVKALYSPVLLIIKELFKAKIDLSKSKQGI